MRIKYNKIAEYLNVLSNPIRLQILDLTSQKPRSVTELTNKLKLRKANVSQQLSLLRYQNFVQTKRDGKKVFYSTKDGVIKKILKIFNSRFNSALK